MTKPVAVVTGSSSGIGAASARKFAQNGWNVAINFSRDEGAAQAVAEQCRELGADALVVRADVASDADCRALASQVNERWNRADVLVNNAGRTKFVDFRNLDGLSADDFVSIYSVNVVGPYQMTRALLPLLAKQNGAGIVNVSSIAAVLGMGSSIAYAASKGALNTMTLALARALGPGVRVNAVAPGMVDGEWLRTGLGPERFEAVRKGYESRAALESIVTPEDVAETIFWLGAGAPKTTGEVVLVDGGMKVGRM
jgi:3-oxoacyl-[acyl-carrier protein] reductase